MQQCKRILAAAFLLLIAAFSAGCLAAAAGAGVGTFHAMSNVDAAVQANPPEVVAATRAVFAEMDIATVSIEESENEAYLKGYTPQDKTVRVRVEKQAEGLSELDVRVGRLGNQPVSQAIYQRILEELK